MYLESKSKIKVQMSKDKSKVTNIVRMNDNISIPYQNGK